MEMTSTLARLVMEQEAKQREMEEKKLSREEPVEEMSPGRRALHEVFRNARKVPTKLARNA